MTRGSATLDRSADRIGIPISSAPASIPSGRMDRSVNGLWIWRGLGRPCVAAAGLEQVMQHCTGTKGTQGGQQHCRALNDDEGNHPTTQCGEGGERVLGLSVEAVQKTGPKGQGANSSSPMPACSLLVRSPLAAERMASKIRCPTWGIVSSPSRIVPALRSMSPSIQR